MNWRNTGAWLVSSLLILSGAVDRARKKAFDGDYILSFYFHHPTKAEFEFCVKWLLKHEFSFLSLSDLEDIRSGKVPFPKGAALLTVDDGWKSNEKNIAEVADRYEIPVTIFVSTEPVEQGVYWWSYVEKARSLNLDFPTKEQLKMCANAKRLEYLNTIKNHVRLPREAMTMETISKISKSNFVHLGGHTHTHPILVNCDQEEIEQELSISKQKLEEWIGMEVSSFAYPNGDFGIREKKVLKELNYKYGFTTCPEYLSPKRLNDMLEIPRFGFMEGASKAENICRMVGVWHTFISWFWKNGKTSKELPSQQVSNAQANPLLTNQ